MVDLHISGERTNVPRRRHFFLTAVFLYFLMAVHPATTYGDQPIPDIDKDKLTLAVFLMGFGNTDGLKNSFTAYAQALHDAQETILPYAACRAKDDMRSEGCSKAMVVFISKMMILESATRNIRYELDKDDKAKGRDK